MKNQSILLILTTIAMIFWLFLSINDGFHYFPLGISIVLYVLVLTLNKDPKIMLGAVLYAYASFLSPAYVDPSDLIISTGWLALSASLNIPLVLIAIWMLSGYVAFVIALLLFGMSLHEYLKKIKYTKPSLFLSR